MTEKQRLIFGIAVLLSLLAVLAFWAGTRDEQVACTMEAKICPDGSAVGRTGPMCEFAACPGTNTIDDGAIGEFWGTIQGTVLLGPTCPVQREPPDPNCDDRPFETRLALATADGSRVIKEFSSDKSGKFYIEVAPGEYTIRDVDGARMMPSCGQTDIIKVPVNGSIEVAVSCDTGIR